LCGCSDGADEEEDEEDEDDEVDEEDEDEDAEAAAMAACFFDAIGCACRRQPGKLFPQFLIYEIDLSVSNMA
jgi:hypothetical protein